MNDRLVPTRALTVAAAASSRDDARTRAALASHQANLAAVGGDEAIERCLATDRRTRLTCVTAAKTRDELARCPPR